VALPSEIEVDPPPFSHPRATSPLSRMRDQSDHELVALAREGNSAAFDLIVQRHQRRIHRVALHLVRDEGDAEDVTQETFIRAYRALDRFDGRSEPFTWMYRIAVNLSLNHLRSRKRAKQSTGLDDPRVDALLVEQRPGRADPGRDSAERALAAALCQAIDGLSETLRTTLVLVALDGLGHGEAAAVLGCPEGTVAWRVHEARRKLRLALAARGYSDPEGGAA
jgi:RNA polymerase sigma-70 factor, ECF subfamily